MSRPGIGGVITASSLPSELSKYTGWADYGDTQYTTASPWSPSTGTWVDVPNNAGLVLDSQKPIDVDKFYDVATGTITGRLNDGVSITIDFVARPTTATETYVDVAFFIGNNLGPFGDGRIYQRLLTFPKGNGVDRPYSFNVDGYTLASWQASGAKLQINTNAAIEVFKIRCVVTRTHKGR